MATNNAMFFRLEPGEYVVFVDSSTVDVPAVAKAPLPEGVRIQVVPVRCNPGQTVSQAVLLEKMDALDRFMIAQGGDPFAEGEPN